MELMLFTTAEYANISNSNKLNIMGIFDSIQTTEFPATIPTLYLVAQLKAFPAEYGQVFDIRFCLIDAQDIILLDVSGAGEVPVRGDELGVLMNQVLHLTSITLETPGDYRFTLELNGNLIGVLPFKIVQMGDQ